MRIESNIFNKNNYHVNKKFHKQVKGPLSYMIKVVGIDCESKTVGDKKPKVCNEQIIVGHNEKFLKLVLMFFFMKKIRRRVKRTEVKTNRYEEVEETV